MTDAPEAIRQAFSAALGVECSKDDDFFDLGGDSVLAEDLMCRLSALFGQELSLGLLLDYPTPSDLGEFLQSCSES